MQENIRLRPVLACEKHLFTLHGSMVRTSFDLWATEEQKAHWVPKLNNYSIMVTYAQTEIGHGKKIVLSKKINLKK